MQRLALVPAVLPPEPTTPPDAVLVARRLEQRSISLTTCGWVNGDFGSCDSSQSTPVVVVPVGVPELTCSRFIIASPVTCSEEESCFSFTSQSVHACCPALFECFPPTTCLDSTAYVTACNTDCQADLSTLKW